MQIIDNPEKKRWPALLARPAYHTGNLDAEVRRILDDVKKNGDKAVDDYTLQFDQVHGTERNVPETEIDEAENKLDHNLKKAIGQAKLNIEKFHSIQLLPEPEVQIQTGIRCWRKSVAIEKVGLYIPGGTAPLFSTLLMLAVPATLAGCEEIIICTPAQKDGTVHPA